MAQVDPGIQLGRFLLAVGKDASTVTGAMALRDFLESMVVREATVHRSSDDVTALRHCLDRIAGSRPQPTTPAHLGNPRSNCDDHAEYRPKVDLSGTGRLHQGTRQEPPRFTDPPPPASSPISGWWRTWRWWT